MCGVIGYVPRSPGGHDDFVFARLLKESEARGMHAYGISQGDATTKSHDRDRVISAFVPGLPAVAHTRYSTSGDYLRHSNNQPIVSGGLSLVMNGVIHQGTRKEFETEFGVQCDSENDAEVFLRRIVAEQTAEEFLNETRCTLAAIWMIGSRLWAIRCDVRPLWVAQTECATWIASTSDIMRRSGLLNAERVPAGLLMEFQSVPWREQLEFSGEGRS